MSKIKENAPIREFLKEEKLDKELQEFHLEEVRDTFIEKFRLARKHKTMLERAAKKLRIQLVDEREAHRLGDLTDTLITKTQHETMSVDMDLKGLKDEFKALFDEELDV